jgi:hypothetical protein
MQSLLETKAQNAFTRDLERNKLQATYDKMRLDANIAANNLAYQYSKMHQDYELGFANMANQRGIAEMQTANSWNIAKLNSSTSMRNADVAAAASRYGADVNAAAHRYSADKSFAASKYATDMNKLMSMTRIRNEGLWNYNRNLSNQRVAQLNANTNYKLQNIKNQSAERIAAANRLSNERIKDADRKQSVAIKQAELDKDYYNIEYKEAHEGSRSWISTLYPLIKGMWYAFSRV